MAQTDTQTAFYSASWFLKIKVLKIQGLFQTLENFQNLQTLIYFSGLHPEKKMGLYQGLLSQVGQSHDPGKRKGVPSKQYIGANFSLLESQTSYIGFEFSAKPSLCPR